MTSKFRRKKCELLCAGARVRKIFQHPTGLTFSASAIALAPSSSRMRLPIKELREDKLTKLELRSKGLGATEGIVLGC